MENPRRSLEFRLLDQADKIRIVVVGVLLVALFTAPAAMVANLRIAASVVTFAAIYALFTHLVLDWRSIRREGHVHLMAAFLVCTDILCISVFLWAMGAPVSGLAILLLLEVVFAAAFFSGLELAFVAAMVCGAYAILGLSTTQPSPAWHTLGGIAASIVVGWLAYGLAETARRELASTNRIVQYLTEGVMLVTGQGKLVVVNPRIEHMLGVNASEIVGLNIFDPDNSAALEPLADLLADITAPRGARNDVGARYLHIEDPTPLEIQSLTVPCLAGAGQVIAWVVVCKDVTEIMTTVRVKEEGIAILSHELRGRLSSIRAASELLLHMADVLTPEERDQAVRMLDDGTRRLSHLVTRTLEAVAVGRDSAEFEFEPAALGALAQQACDELRAAAEEKQVALRVEIAGDIPLVRGDPARLDQVLHNLIDNGIKYTPANGEVRVEVIADADAARVCVTDTGPGIPQDRLNVIFEKFTHATDGIAAYTEGALGLGLYISREIVKRHGGRIHVESVEGEGAAFTFTVPYSVAEVSEAIETTDTSGGVRDGALVQ